MNLLLISRDVPDFQVFVDAANEHTRAVLYSPSMTQAELLESIQLTSAERIAVVSRKDYRFVERKPVTASEEFFKSMIQTLGVKTIDFLACNTLKDPRWTRFYTSLQAAGVTVGASNDLTGNLKYGGDWVMESTGQDIELIYFTKTIEYYKYLLDLNTNFDLIVKEDGFLYGIGDNNVEQLGIDNNLTVKKIKAITNEVGDYSLSACGEAHTVFIKDGNLYGMGNNGSGRLGISGDTSTPRQITTDGGVTHAACGYDHTVFVKDGNLYGMGNNGSGRLGISGDTSTPLQITTGGGVTHASCGESHTVFIKDGNLYGMGNNGSGRLGITGITTTPRQITTDGGVTHTACGYSHTVFVKGGNLYGMGDNGFGQLGITGDTTTPRQITTGVTQAACGFRHTVFVKDGNLYGMGDNWFGRLGIAGDTTTPRQITTDVDQVACGKYHTVFVKDGNLYGMGDNTDRLLGITGNTMTPRQITTDGRVTHAACGYFHTVFIKNGILYGMGRNHEGRLGIKHYTTITSFIQSKIDDEPISGVTQIACGDSHTVFVKSENLYGMGGNYYGELGITGDITTSELNTTQITTGGGVTHAACGVSHTVFVKYGNLYVMGDNSEGQLGITETYVAYMDTPRQITTDGGVTQTACGYSHTVFIKDGNLYGMGNNGSGRLGITGDTTTPQLITTGVTQVACGSTHTVFIKDGNLYGMGDNTDGRLGITGDASTPQLITTGVTQVACGANHILFVKNRVLYGTLSYLDRFNKVRVLFLRDIGKKSSTYNIKSTVIFPINSVVYTDQGQISLTDLTLVHTIKGNKISSITTIYNKLNEPEKKIVLLNNDSYL